MFLGLFLKISSWVLLDLFNMLNEDSKSMSISHPRIRGAGLVPGVAGGVITARQIGQCISDHALVLLLGFNGIVLVLEVKRVVVVEGFAEVVLIVQVAEVVLDSE